MERVDDARRLFERLLGLRNDLGQAFSHIALVNTAQNLSRVNKPPRAKVRAMIRASLL